MSIQYTIHVKGGPHPEKPRRSAAFTLRSRKLISRAQGPFTIERDDNGDLGPDRTVAETNAIVRNWRRTAKVGSRLDVHAQDTVLAFKVVEVSPPVAAPNTSAPIAKVYVRVFTKHGYVTNLGNWYCRFIAGTREVSRHGYHAADDSWYGDAQDFGCPTADQLSALADEIVRWVSDSTDELYGKLEHVIVHDRIWSKGSGWSGYGGIYHYHVHCDNNSGVPCSP